MPDTIQTPQRVADFESLIAEVSSRLIGLAAGDVDREIDEVLRRICAWFDIDFAVLWQWSHESPDVIVATHYRYAEQGQQRPEPLDERQFPWYRQQMLGGRLIAISSLADLPPEAATDHEHGRLLGIKSNLCIPLTLGGERPVGALAFNIVRQERHWPKVVVKQLQLVAQLITTALARQRANRALRESEERLRAGAELAGLGFYEVDHRAGVLHGDDRFCDLLGIVRRPASYAEVLQQWAERLHPEDRSHVLELREQLHTGKLDRVATEYRYLHPARGEIWIDHLSAVVERDADGRMVRNIGVLLDIGPQKRTELELREMGHRLLQAQEQERALIARELHDDLSQRLAVLTIEVARAEGAAADAGQPAKLRSIREELVRVSDDVHALAYQLHPSVLEELGLAEALRAECERRARQGGLELSVSIDALPDGIGSDTALCLFRVAQEALSNASRHAKAGKASVQLLHKDGGLCLAVQDDGVGFDKQQLDSRGRLGLVSMRERMWIVNGTLDIDSVPGSGTTVIAWVPVEGAAS